jgi:thioesterase domain-containing protein
MLPIWRRTLNVSTLGPDDDFFALGGHSMLAAQLFWHIERELGLAAPLAALHEAPTPRLLSRALTLGNARDTWRSLAAIKRTGTRTPLFLVHAAEGNVLLYRNLARYLPANQPVYGLQAEGLDGKTTIQAQFELVARRYIQEIQQVQPHGPYLLGGYCLGGTIALEMARQLLDAGESVGLLAMIENFNVKSGPWPLPWRLRLANWFLNPYYHLANLFAAAGTGKWHFFREKAQVELTRAKVSVQVAASRAHRLLGTSNGYHHLKVADAFDRALEHYEVKPYPGQLTVFKAARHLAGMGDPQGGWSEVALGGLRVLTLPISPRGSLIEPFVQTLAAHLAVCLEEAAANNRPTEQPSDAPVAV